MTYRSNSTDNTLFSLEEIRQELARCGYDGVSKQTLLQFQKDLSNLAHNDKAKREQEKSIVISLVLSTIASKSGSFVLVKVDQKRNVQSNVDFTIHPINRQTQSDNEDNYNDVDDESLIDAINTQSITPRLSTSRTKQNYISNVNNDDDDDDDNHSQSSQRIVRRKVLRHHNGAATVFDESRSETSSIIDTRDGDYLNHSLHSNNKFRNTCRIKNDNDDTRSDYSDQTCSSSNTVHAVKSFIRPSSSASSIRRSNSSFNNNSDSVQLYSYYKNQWQSQRAPGEKSHQSLRWSVRDQLLRRHDVPIKRKMPPRVNNYVVPTEKKRSSLRWEIRYALANPNKFSLQPFRNDDLIF
ncbi:unnamed protein product [Didymodactylos carnosus]|uniref:Centriolar and ciliogenesis-associated protein HYLS1 C-terminal domain-containing protein n=1 Tax=Didymodactylos carnosus TaxID=1234261 RepID=A0A813Y061_9BILA|nr:unnamed protein product [Didymodactylos carnosus]CAF3659987.1 unnamed protein product [Didymodactylos carnosus]